MKKIILLCTFFASSAFGTGFDCSLSFANTEQTIVGIRHGNLKLGQDQFLELKVGPATAFLQPISPSGFEMLMTRLSVGKTSSQSLFPIEAILPAHSLRTPDFAAELKCFKYEEIDPPHDDEE